VQRRSATILVYHDPSPETMETHLRALRRRYNLISLASYISSRSGGAALPRKSLVITLDDGHVGNSKLRTVFERFEVRPTIFVCTGLVGTRRGFWFRHARDVEVLKRLPNKDRISAMQLSGFSPDAERAEREALSDGEILALASVADIESHTATHPILPTCTDEEARSELSGSKAHLEQRFGFAVYALAYPNGDYSDRELSLARAAGYACALTVDAGSNSPSTDLFRLKRIAVDDHDSVDAVIVKASGLWGLIKRFTSGRRHGYVGRPLFTAQP
jgi:poly-beta-1,6-N-acetyl-D-glucosamine N-deacetylase